MFKSKITKKNVVNAGGGTVVANRINQDCSINGTIVSTTDIRIDGTIHGSVSSEAKVVIGPTGKVIGDIQCVDLTVEGSVEGNIHVSRTLYFRKTSQIGPHLAKFQKIIIEEGATLQCQLLPLENLSNT
ncbi:MAG TPA: polymer-forming cytoskeletal protein [Chitinophagales bacterium]|nr:polymer-forming cytoskeletal protein [Chitinophagales bacterium]